MYTLAHARFRPGIATIALLSAALLSACGGDGSSGGPSGPQQTPSGPADATTLVITPATLNVSTQLTTTVKVTMSNGAAPTEELTTKSANERVVFARHDSVVGRAEGTATITVTAGARSGSFTVRVTPDVAIGAFAAPLDSVPSLVNVFDHDKPHEFTDNNGYLLTYWGDKTNGIDGHNGYDWPVAEGTPVRAVAAGTVTFAGTETPFPCPVLNNTTVAGLWISIAHAASPNELIVSQYGHFSRIDVKAGDRVAAGQQIGLSGTTGCSTGPHLHFSTFRYTGNETVPRPYAPLQTRVMDPFGWSGPTTDPWVADSAGMESIPLWSGPKAPTAYKMAGMPGGAQVLPAYVRYFTSNDATLEYVDVAAVTPGEVDISGWSIETLKGVRYVFPTVTSVSATRHVRLYSGKGTNSGTTLYWGNTFGVWGNLGDCVTVRRPDGAVEYSKPYGIGGCDGVAALANAILPMPLEWSPGNRAPVIR